jgi:large subunit ribosomal protein L6
MKKQLEQIIAIPEGVEVSFVDKTLKVKGPEGENSRELNLGNLDLKVSGNEIKISHNKATKNEKKIMNTLASHIKNLIRGVQEKFTYELKVASSHFPMTVKVEGRNASVKNYYGEKIERKTTIPEGVEVEVKKDIIIIKSVDKELAGQASANLEMVTKVRNRDRRIFQDGIYITKKDGKAI